MHKFSFLSPAPWLALSLSAFLLVLPSSLSSSVLLPPVAEEPGIPPYLILPQNSTLLPPPSQHAVRTAVDAAAPAPEEQLRELLDATTVYDVSAIASVLANAVDGDTITFGPGVSGY
jgi:hypothetical protein